MNLSDFEAGKTFEIVADNGKIIIYRDGIEYHKPNKTEVECWSVLNFVDPDLWCEYFPLAVELYKSLTLLSESDLMVWLTNFKNRSEYEIL